MDGRAQGLGVFQRQTPVTALPAQYRESYHFSVTDPSNLLWLNVFSIALIAPFLILMIGWGEAVEAIRGARPGNAGLPNGALWAAALSVLVIHEYIHGVMIYWADLRPRYGIIWRRIAFIPIPLAFYATPATGYFRRGAFIAVALAPAGVITAGAMALMLVLPDDLHIYLIAAVIINGAGAVGDFWMTAVAMRYPASALVQDQADAIRIFTAGVDASDR